MTAATRHGTPATGADPVALDRLHTHLRYEHHRSWHELAGLPLDAVHELEHFDVTIGLLHLDHTHAA